MSCFFRLFTFFSALLVLNTGTLIMGVLMLALATMRISLNLSGNRAGSILRALGFSISVRSFSQTPQEVFGDLRETLGSQEATD